MNQTKITKMAWATWSISACFYAYRYILDVFPGVAAKDLMLSFHADATMLGHLAAFYLYAYSAMQIPVGILLDRFGPRKLVTVAALVAAVGCLILADTSSFAIAVSGRLIIGLGASCAIVSALYVAATQLPTRQYALAAGLIITIGMIGAICGEMPVAALIAKIGWRNTLRFFTILGIFLSAFLWSFVAEKKQSPTTPLQDINTIKTSLLTGLKSVLKNPQSWLIACYGSFMFLPTIVFGSLWGVTFLTEKLDINVTKAASLTSAIFIGWAIGAPAFGWFSDKINSRKIIMFIASLGACLCMIMILYYPRLTLFSAPLYLFLFGLFSGGFLVSFAAIREINAAAHMGAATGFMNLLNMLGGAFSQPLIGLILDHGWNGVMQNGVRFYSTYNFQLSLSLLPIFMLIAAFIVLFIKESYNNPIYENS